MIKVKTLDGVTQGIPFSFTGDLTGKTVRFSIVTSNPHCVIEAPHVQTNATVDPDPALVVTDFVIEVTDAVKDQIACRNIAWLSITIFNAPDPAANNSQTLFYTAETQLDVSAA